MRSVATVMIALALGPSLLRAGEEQPYLLRIEDAKGSYSIPFIQSDRTLEVRVDFQDAAATAAAVRLLRAGQSVAEHPVSPAAPVAKFPDLAPGEYALDIQVTDRAGKELYRIRHNRIGIGTVLAAIGDSITEGYHGHGFWRDDLELRAEHFPPAAVSHDGRNFPQFAPTTAWHKPDINCFQSWMTDLNNSLTDTWKQPVYIANEGWGGITTGAYLQMMRADAGWQTRMKRLAPRLWLIHLGVNDERAKVPAATVSANLNAIVDLLIKEYQAASERILVCRPCYDYADGAKEILQTYIAEIDRLVAARGLRLGPDFFAAYATEKERWYGADPVHPNIEGVEYMARLWHDAICRAFPTPPR